MAPLRAAFRSRRLRFAFALSAALVSGAWDDCCCYGPPRLADPAGYGPRVQPFAGNAYYLFSYDGGPSLGTKVGAKGWEPSLRLSAAWSRLGDISYEGRPAYVTSLARENDEYSYVGTNLGLLGVSLGSGSIRSFSGLPSGSPGVWNLLRRSTGVFAGLSSAPGAGIPLLYQCQLSSAACSAVSGGPTSTQAGDGAWSLRTFSGATYGLTDVGMWSSPNGQSFFREPTPSARHYDIGGVDGSLVVTTGNGAYKGPGRGQPWTADNTGLGTGCAGVAYVGSTFYVVCNYPSLQVYKRFRTDLTWTSTALTLSAYGFGLETDGADLVLGTTAGPMRYHAGTWAPDDDCYKSPSATLAVRLDAQTLAAGGDLTGFAESTDKGRTWTSDPSTFRLSANFIRRNSQGTYFTGSTGTFYRPAGQTAFQAVTVPGGAAYSLGSAGDTVLAGLRTGGLGRLAGSTFQAENAGFDTSAAVNGFASNGSSVVALTSKGSYFSGAVSLSWTKGANRSDGQPFAGQSGIALQSGEFLLGGYGNGAGWNIARSSANGSSLTGAGAGIPDAAVVWDLAEIPKPPSLRTVLTGSAAGATTLVAATSRGLYVSFDDAASWSLLSKELGTAPVIALAVDADRLWVATSRRGLRSYSLPLAFRRLVPIVLDVDTGSAHYTTELALTNPGSTTANVTLQYTAALGSGSATVSDTLAPGRQLVIPDVLSYLRGKGASIPVGGSQGGTLLLTFTNVSATGLPAVTARTAAATGAPLPVGRAGLAYAAHDPDEGSRGSLTVFGLRSNATDRSNLAVYNTSNEAVTFSVTAFSGDGSGASAVIAAGDTLPAWGWRQYTRILEGPGYAQGWVRVTRTSTTGSFGVYGVVNDNGTNDGSLVGPGGSPETPAYTNVPVLVETGAFVSELVLANADAAGAVFHLTYRESLAGSGGGSTDVSVPARSQLVIPNAIAYLRTHGVSIGAAGAAGYGGSLHVEVTGANAASTWVGARTSAPAGPAGQFGLFTPSAAPGAEGSAEAWIFGLRADAENRSNVAVVNTGDLDDGSITLSVQAYDGDAGGTPRGTPASVVLAPGQWQQLNGFLGSAGVANGWVKVTRTAGFAPWIAYGVVNDGGAPGQRTSDGAYVAMVR